MASTDKVLGAAVLVTVVVVVDVEDILHRKKGERATKRKDNTPYQKWA